MAEALVNVPVVREFMKSKGWSELDMAQAMDIRYPTLYRVLREQRTPGNRVIAGFARVGLALDRVLILPKPLTFGNDHSEVTGGGG